MISPRMAIFQFSSAVYNSLCRVRHCGLFFVHFQSVRRCWPCSAFVWADILKDFMGAVYDISRRHDFTANALSPLGLTVHLGFQTNPWALGEGELYRCFLSKYLFSFSENFLMHLLLLVLEVTETYATTTGAFETFPLTKSFCVLSIFQTF